MIWAPCSQVSTLIITDSELDLFHYMITYRPDYITPRLQYQHAMFLQALQLAALATEASEFKDWWWKIQLGKCYFR